MVHRVLVAVDGTAASKTALEIACALADKYEAALGLLAVTEPDAISEEVIVGAQLEGVIPPDKTYGGVYDTYWMHSFDDVSNRAANALQLATRVAEHIVAKAEAFSSDKPFKAIKTFTSRGDPATAILDCARENAADIIIMGHDQQSRAAALFKSSVANEVQLKANCPVLIYCQPQG